MKKSLIILSIILLMVILPYPVVAKYIMTKHQEITMRINTVYDSNNTIILNEK